MNYFNYTGSFNSTRGSNGTVEKHPRLKNIAIKKHYIGGITDFSEPQYLSTHIYRENERNFLDELAIPQDDEYNTVSQEASELEMSNENQSQDNNSSEYAWTKDRLKSIYESTTPVKLQTSIGESASAISTSPSSGKKSADKTVNRGKRNNNWLNIRISGEGWQGKIPISENTDGAFEQFKTPELGIRAAAINLKTYWNRGLRTVQDIIMSWAPPEDKNNTQSYIQNVAARMGVAPTQVLDLNNKEVMFSLISAMTISEIGDIPDESVIREGIQMA